MLNRKAMREIICLMGTKLAHEAGDKVDLQGNYSFISADSKICVTITPRPDRDGRDGMLPHIWVKEMHGNDGFYFLFSDEKEGYIEAVQINHPRAIYEGLTGAEILAQWPENLSPNIRPYFVTMLELYDQACPA